MLSLNQIKFINETLRFTLHYFTFTRVFCALSEVFFSQATPLKKKKMRHRIRPYMSTCYCACVCLCVIASVQCVPPPLVWCYMSKWLLALRQGGYTTHLTSVLNV